MASAHSARSPHHSLFRRLRRRYPLPPLLYAAYLLELLPLAAGLSWLARDHGWAALADITRRLWLVGNVVFLLLLIAGALMMSMASKERGAVAGAVLAKTRTGMLQQSVLCAATTGSLLAGRTDWAIVAWYGGSALHHGWQVLRFRGPAWRNTARAVLRALLSLTILSGWPALFAVAAFLSLWTPTLFKPSTAALIAEKISRAEFVRQELDARDGDPLGLLRLWCETELWDEALKQHRKLSPAKGYSPDQLAEYLARIYVGRGQFAEVLRLNDHAAVVIQTVEAHLHLGQPERARQIAEQAASEKKPGASFAMGAVYDAAGELEAALACYERQAFHWKSMRDVPSVRAAARVLMALGDYREARVMLELAVQRAYFLQRAEVLSLAECLRKLGKQELAGRVEAVLARCAEACPSDLPHPAPAPTAEGSTRKSRRACPRRR